MSVGVCIINRNGIALAADSAGTYTGNKMFYNSMNKVHFRENIFMEQLHMEQLQSTMFLLTKY